jgi:hypothetical protein
VSAVAAAPTIEFEKRGHKYKVNGEVYPSVTEVLGIINKPALAPWAERMTVEGLLRLIKKRGVGFVEDKDARQILGVMRSDGLGAGRTKEAAAARGTAVHEALEAWATKRDVPVASKFPTTTQGYIRGLARFLLEREPQFFESEKPVASLKHRFVGTRDTVCLLDDGEHGRCLLDLKTSKRVYATSHFPQLEAYELAGVEMGEEPTQRRGVIRVDRDGTYEIAWSCATADDFLAVLACYRAQRSLERRARR